MQRINQRMGQNKQLTLSYDALQLEWYHQFLSECINVPHECNARNIHTYQFLKRGGNQKQKKKNNEQQK